MWHLPGDTTDRHVHDRRSRLRVWHHDVWVSPCGGDWRRYLDLRDTAPAVSGDAADAWWHVHGGNGRDGGMHLRHDDVPMSRRRWRDWRRVVLQLTPAR